MKFVIAAHPTLSKGLEVIAPVTKHERNSTVGSILAQDFTKPHLANYGDLSYKACLKEKLSMRLKGCREYPRTLLISLLFIRLIVRLLFPQSVIQNPIIVFCFHTIFL